MNPLSRVYRLPALLIALAACQTVEQPQTGHDPALGVDHLVPGVVYVQVHLEGIEDDDPVHDDVRVDLSGQDLTGTQIAARSTTGATRDADHTMVFEALPATLERGAYRVDVSHDSGAFVGTREVVRFNTAGKAHLRVELSRRRLAPSGLVTTAGGEDLTDGIVSLHTLDRIGETGCVPGDELARASIESDGHYTLGDQDGVPMPVSKRGCLVVRVDNFATRRQVVDLAHEGEVQLPEIALTTLLGELAVFSDVSWTDANRRPDDPGDAYVGGRLVGLQIRLSGPQSEQFDPAHAQTEIAIAETEIGEEPTTLEFRAVESLPRIAGRTYLGPVAPANCRDGVSTALANAWAAGELDDERSRALLPFCLTRPGMGPRTITLALRNRWGSTFTLKAQVVLDDGADRDFAIDISNAEAVEGRFYTRDDALTLTLETRVPIDNPADWCVATAIRHGAETSCPSRLNDWSVAFAEEPPPCEQLPPSRVSRVELPRRGDEAAVRDGTFRLCAYLQGPEGRSDVASLHVERLTEPFEVRIRPDSSGTWRATTCDLDAARQAECGEIDPLRINGPIRFVVDVQPRERAWRMEIITDDERDDPVPFLDSPVVWSFNGADGVRSLKVKVYDRANAPSSSQSVEFYLDTAPPRLPAIRLLVEGEVQACQRPDEARICEEAADTCRQCRDRSHPCRFDTPPILPIDYIVGGRPVVRPRERLVIETGVVAQELQSASGQLCMQVSSPIRPIDYAPVCASGNLELVVPDPGYAVGEPELETVRVGFVFHDQACNVGDSTTLTLDVDRRPPRVRPLTQPCMRVVQDPEGRVVSDLSTGVSTSGCLTAGQLSARTVADDLPILRGVRAQLEDFGTQRLQGEVRYRVLLLDDPDATLQALDNDQTLAGFDGQMRLGGPLLPCPHEPRLLQYSTDVLGPERLVERRRRPVLSASARCQGHSPEPDNAHLRQLCRTIDGVPDRPVCGGTSRHVLLNAEELLPHILGDSRHTPDASDGACYADGACTARRIGYPFLILEDAVGNRDLVRLWDHRVQFRYGCTGWPDDRRRAWVCR